MGFTKWHKGLLETFKVKFGLNDYQIAWIAFFKGILIGGLIVYFYMR